MANLFLKIYTEFLGNVPPAPGAPPNFLIPPGLVTGCTLMSPPYSVGGTVTGLALSATVTLVNQSNGDSTTVTGGGTGTDSFTFPADLNPGAAYNIAVTTQPTNPPCSSTNASGNIVEGNVTNVVFTCTANAGTLNITYYTISTSDPDPENLGYPPTTYSCTDYVASSLGTAYGLPVVNPSWDSACGNNPTLVPPSGPTDVSADGEILWWSAVDPNVTYTGTAVVSLPFSNLTFFPPGGTGPCDGSDISGTPSYNANCVATGSSPGFQAAVLAGQLIVTDRGGEQVTFSLTVDDMAFVYVDGTYVCGLGGVQPATSTACTTSIAGGNHTLEVFYVDMAVVGAVLNFNVTASSIVVSP